MQEYWVPRETTFFEQEIKRSRFLTWIKPVSTIDEVDSCLQNISTQHPDARHVCWAYILGPPNSPIQKANDDGEPSGTAGKPILNVLQHSGCGDIIAVVARYFGGIKLGAGGLVRAYSSSTSQTLKVTPLSKKEVFINLTIDCDFAQESTLRHLLSLQKGEIQHVDYTDHSRLQITLPASKEHDFLTSLPNTIEIKI
ncbi:MAG: FIG000605: protein co-occurring with transport systems (COG1739) [uncultured Thiotrichaceae bacterium]|uniref:FIG000605: protein co-occurring with transport systems (COG1739) n=1 Tax=uncultured Thiotrichaceae bacterium TaxID=298394 RepID=A0A6S6TYB9_9GAMM|nr:MAG: FIG000605: protein co-occurring with transport systems (COG1739) [uncultured Thiotrichaceae bacterium]